MPHVLEVQPTDLVFPTSSHKVEQRNFTLANRGELSVAFKVKTNSPNRFCVRPAAGTLAPRGSIEIAVMMSPGDAPPDQETKFQIQSVAMTSPTANVHELWEQTVANPKLLNRLRLRVVYSQANTQTPAAGSTGGAAPSAAAVPQPQASQAQPAPAASFADTSAAGLDDSSMSQAQSTFGPLVIPTAVQPLASMSTQAQSQAAAEMAQIAQEQRKAPEVSAAQRIAESPGEPVQQQPSTEHEAALQRERDQLMAQLQVLAKQLAAARARNNVPNASVDATGDGNSGVSCNPFLMALVVLQLAIIAYLVTTR